VSKYLRNIRFNSQPDSRSILAETHAILAAMRHTSTIWLVLIGVALLTGCLSTDPIKFESDVRGWVPIGTPANDALRIMERHSFECRLISTNNPFNLIGFDYIDCEKTQVRFHDWYARFILKDGKVSSYGPITTN
jgi:hypothetical protein